MRAKLVELRGLRGDCTGLRGDCSGLRGDCSGLRGDCTGLIGDLDACEITAEERRRGVDVRDLVAPIPDGGPTPADLRGEVQHDA